MSETIIRTPEFSIASVIKPFANFESVYQGQPVLSNPLIMPGTSDPLAGKPGYDPNLLAGVPVPIGSDILIYIPRILPVYGQTAPIYSYTLIWRVRSQQEAVADENFLLSGNLGPRLPGVPDLTGTSPGPRFVIPAAMETLVFTDAEPSIPSIPAGQNARSLQIEIFGGVWQAPLMPNFPPGGVAASKLNKAGVVSQGLYDDTAVSGSGSDYARAGWRGAPSYNVLQRKSLGNELMIMVSRSAETPNEAWDFAGSDVYFSELFGTNNGARPPIPNTGILLFTGSFA